MGWLSRYDYKPSDWKRDILTDYANGEFCKLIDHKTTCFGKRWWTLIESAAGDRFIVLYLFEKFKGGGWGYKDIDETMHPYHYDCPLSLIEQANSPMNENSAKWRKEVHRQKEIKCTSS